MRGHVGEATEEKKLHKSVALSGEALHQATLGCLMWDLFWRGKLKSKREESAVASRGKGDQWLGPEAVNESILMQRCANVSRGGLMSASW